MARINKSQFAILGLLNKRPLSGYDLIQIFNKFAPFHWSESNAQIYPMLKNLEKAKMVTSKLDSKSGARKRRIYSITKTGVQHLNQWLEQPIEPPKYREEVLLKLSNSQHLPSAVLIKHIQDYQQQLRQNLACLALVVRHVETDHQDRPDQANLLLVYRYSEMVIRTKLKWCAEALAALNKRTT